jgi:hypothetical protein
MNNEIINADVMMGLFDIFVDEMTADNIAFEDYFPTFLKVYNVSENSPMAFMFRGFIGGLSIASVIGAEKTLQEN